MTSHSIAIAVNHDACTECRMCYVVCRELDVNAVYVAPDSRHRFEIDPGRCLYPGCTACLMYCPAPDSIVEVASGRSLVPPPSDVWTPDRRVARGAA
jgi:MinD superfamily P-loop ATPase